MNTTCFLNFKDACAWFDLNILKKKKKKKKDNKYPTTFFLPIP